MAALFTIQLLVALVLLVLAPSTRVSAIYLGLFALFHGGVFLVIAVGLKPSAFGASNALRWLDDPSMRHALALTSWFSTAFAWGVVLNRWVPINRRLGSRHRITVPDQERLARAGLWILCIGVAFWLLPLISHGPSLLVASYGTFRSAADGPFVAYAYLAIGIGLVLVVGSGRSMRAGVTVFVLFAAVSLPLGLRGEVLFPLAAALVVLVIQGRCPPWRVLLVFGAIALLLIPIIRTVRIGGLGDTSSSEITLNPLDTFDELGRQVRPVTAVLNWHQSGDGLLNGSSYTAPVERALVAITPFSTKKSATSDERLLNRVVSQREGPIGFSPVAESVRNFGDAGPLLVGLAFGFLFGLLGRTDSRSRLALYGALVSFVLFVNVRNSFSFVPGQLLAALGLLWLVLNVRFRRPPPRLADAGGHL